ncbi:MAG TPA: tRNA dihydrouridine synthase DusB [Candidatus Nanoarchaeia archaeon]|nr:tRNA dihydrouridine synthase DusB [Candidatus Nanoarchaeia archaeon]
MEFPKLKNPLVLAPMADVSHLGFRLLCRRYGAALAYTEQLSSLAIIRDNKKTFELAAVGKDEHPVGVQLFGRNPDVLVDAAKKLEKNFDIIDLNFGCPAKKIVQQGYGSALLKEKDKIHDIIHALVSNIKKPITVKMRSGFKTDEALELVKVIEKAGASAIAIHGRTQEQGYSGKANWDTIKNVKAAVSIPVIGNGDIVDPLSAEKLLNYSKCDYIMIGRAAMCNPWIFKQILTYLETGKIIEQTLKEKISLFFEYLEIDPHVHIRDLRRHAIDFTSGLRGSKEVREQVSRLKERSEMMEIMERFKNGA